MKINRSVYLLFVTLSLLTIAGCSAQEAVGAASSGPVDAGANSGSFSSEVKKPEAMPDTGNQPAQDAVGEDVTSQALTPTSELVKKGEQGAGSNPITEQTAPDAPAAEALQELPPAEPRIGYLAPEIQLPALNGDTVSLSDLRGKNVIINYWVTWCVPCMDELPALERLYRDFQQQDLVILSVNGIEQDELSEVGATVNEFGLTYPVLLDEQDAVHDSYWIQFLPTTFFIDKQGIIRDILKGSTTEQDFRYRIEQLTAGIS